MRKQWSYFFFLLWFTYLIVVSILLFSRGFLLSKYASKSNSTCLTLPEVPCVGKTPDGLASPCNEEETLKYMFSNINSASSICLPQRSKVILIIIDALRYDFTLFNPQLARPEHFQNKLPIIDELRREHPDSSRLYKFIADPPTTTMQRIKALTTGSLPTFIDAGSNFATNEINEDNIIDQLLRHNIGTVLIGDDTWDGLYPNRFLRKYPYPSFDVWDLDTVDKGVNLHLYPELNETDWGFLIAHYLGVDHAGHRYGPSHPEMARKLTEMNTVIKDVAASLEDDTMLFVIGDHGMTVTGNHGGDSDDEVTAAMFVYSKKPLTKHEHSLKTVRQVSLVPTFAAIFGISVPFSNLGTLIIDSIPLFDSVSTENWRFLLFYLWSNVQQMMNYIEDYSMYSSETFSAVILNELKEKYAILNSNVYSVSTEEKFNEFAKDCETFLNNLRESCEAVWIQFDSYSMTRGLLFLFVTMFFVFVITDGIPSTVLPKIFETAFLPCSYFVNLLAAIFAAVLYHFNYVANLTSTVFFFTAMVSQIMFVFLIVQHWDLISLNWHDRSKKERIPNFICRLVLIFHLCGLFSNSFVVEESSVLLFLLNTVILIGSLTVSKQDPKKKFKFRVLLIAFVVLGLVRLSRYFWTCRDRLEQPWCYETDSNFDVKAETTKIQWIATVIGLGLFVTSTKVWLRNCGNLNGFSISILFLRYIPTVLVVSMSGYWVLNRLPNQLWQTNVLVWVVYVLTFMGISLIVLKPLCIYILPTSSGAGGNVNSIPHLFKQVKEMLNEQDEVPVICGLGTVYSAVFLAIGVYFTLLFALLHGDALAPSTVIMFITAAFVLIVMSVIRLETASNLDDLFTIPNGAVLVWVILAQYFFYGTGHQPSFPNIMWDAAFVGTKGITNNFISGTLIILNTFASQILMGFLLPLLIIMPFTISVMLPSFVKKNVMPTSGLTGEVLLYERDGTMLTVAFTTICKYAMCHGIRVFATMMTATIHCRHMMIWKIFAPKLIFESIGMFVTLAAILFTYLVLIRVNSKVNGLIVMLNKRYS